jgi:hypothetical protein
MSSAEQAPKMEPAHDHQPASLLGRFPQLTKDHADWLRLSEQLTAVYKQCGMCVRPVMEAAHRSSITHATLEAASRGESAALKLKEPAAEGDTASHVVFDSHIREEVSRAYAAAFAAAGLTALRAAEHPQKFSAPAPELARLAQRAAEALAHGMGLLLGVRQSGSIAQVCAYIGSLESQTDTLLRAFLASPPERVGNNAQQGDADRYSADRQILTALEAMTDRCEDIADAFLAVAHTGHSKR